MAKKVDPRDFLLNTDYEMDKIVYYTDGVISPGTTTEGGYYLNRKPIPHGLPFLPLVFGYCSFDKEFTKTASMPFYLNPRMETTQGGASMAYDAYAYCYTEGGMVYVYYETKPGTEQRPLYYRVFGFEPTNSNAKIGATKSHAKVFTINTDHNYRKLYKKGMARGGETVAINHSFGYVPQCKIWVNTGDGYISGDISTWLENLQITKDRISFKVPTYNDNKWEAHYRIYYDEA